MDLIDKVKTFPLSPGIYMMMDSSGHIIYVGKSKHLRIRVLGYFQPSRQKSRKLENLYYNMKDIDYIVTDTEFEALLLECQYIHCLKPRYNRMMKNPKRYCYTVIDQKQDWPVIDIVHSILFDKDIFLFGPFANKYTVERAIQGLKTYFNIDCLKFPKRNGPCLNYSIGQCIGICTGEHKKKYQSIVQEIIQILHGKNEGILRKMEQMMEDYARAFEFEKAAKFRDYIKALRTVLRQERAIEFLKGAKKLVAFEKLDEKTIKFFLIQGNRVLARKKCSIENKSKLVEAVQATIFSNLQNSQSKQDNKMLGKDEMDEAQIIYHYLQNGNCKYFQLEDHWLEEEHSNSLTEAISNTVEFFL